MPENAHWLGGFPGRHESPGRHFSNLPGALSGVFIGLQWKRRDVTLAMALPAKAGDQWSNLF